MTAIADVSKFLFNTEYSVDKVVLLKSGSYTLPSTSVGYLTTIPHGLPFTPLCSGNWSLVSDFSVAYEYSTGTFPSGNPGYLFQQVHNVFADATNIYLSADNISGSNLTVYYRVYGLQPPDDNSLIDPIASEGDNFIFNTDFNYTKLYLNDTNILPAAGGSPVNTTVLFDDTLVYIPQVTGWIHYDTYNGVTTVDAIHPMATSNGASDGVLLSVYTDRIVFTTQAFGGTHKAYYRVYLDE